MMTALYVECMRWRFIPPLVERVCGVRGLPDGDWMEGVFVKNRMEVAHQHAGPLCAVSEGLCHLCSEGKQIDSAREG